MTPLWTAADAVLATGGTTHGAWAAFGVSIDSRAIEKGDLFVALKDARAQGYRAMQFNFVVTTNADALKIWSDNGFTEVGRLPNAFNHPTEGFVDALILYKTL